MKVVVLASGSEGNVTYIETKNHKILLDLGMNVKYIKEHLETINVNIEDIDYVFISHSHKDHISALKTFIKSYQPIICMSQTMFYEITDLKKYDHVLIYDDQVILDDVKIEMIKTSHDTQDSRSFIVNSDNTSVVYLTDTGYINHKYFEKLKNKTIYLLESNHDIEMLMNGKYPVWLKKRIYSDKGHLSNQDASIYLTKLIGKNTKKIVLMHISKQNNTHELALNTLKETLKEYKISFDDIKCAKQDENIEVII